MSEQLDYWKTCSSCKKAIGFKQKYFECSVSTCQGKRTGYVFCSLPCWECHLPGAKHRDAGAIEKNSPSQAEWQIELAHSSKSTHPSLDSVVPSPATSAIGGGGALDAKNPVAPPQRRIVGQSTSVQAVAAKSAIHSEVLVVVSKMKTYIKEIADMNTSGEVADVLSDLIREACDEAISKARADGRKTVMGRDFN
jgi:hypothetical protein